MHKIIFVILVIVSLCHCSGKANVKTLSATNMVTSDQNSWPFRKIRQLFTDVGREVKPGGKVDNLIVFIHGRGKHPIKAFKKKLLERLESDYGAKVIMFHWPSWSGWFGFPEDKARNSAKEFSQLVQGLRSFRQAHPEIKISLLTQSMGSIVLEEYLKQQEINVFHTIVLNAPASTVQGHQQWLGRMQADNGIYVMVNKNDPLLGKIKFRSKGNRLGKHMKPQEAKSNKVYYINLEDLGGKHRYYLQDDLQGFPSIQAFYQRVLNGLKPPQELQPGRINQLR